MIIIIFGFSIGSREKNRNNLYYSAKRRTSFYYCLLIHNINLCQHTYMVTLIQLLILAMGNDYDLYIQVSRLLNLDITSKGKKLTHFDLSLFDITMLNDYLCEIRTFLKSGCMFWRRIVILLSSVDSSSQSQFRIKLKHRTTWHSVVVLYCFIHPPTQLLRLFNIELQATDRLPITQCNNINYDSSELQITTTI
ncbi:hypothetical protein AGLY_000256 [Aphis glycines]|uniref:Uncharacterized protein n=1 Tax=Aphis glycines TaxID=307491 RepID=A0A6G0U6L3_APHGL|nr:hypothetical protein AGLY_000256 [Aphis glycines]